MDERAKSKVWTVPKCRVGVLTRQVSGPVMTMSLTLMDELDRCLRNNHAVVEDAGAAGRARQEGLTAKLLQRQERCEVKGFIPK